MNSTMKILPSNSISFRMLGRAAVCALVLVGLSYGVFAGPGVRSGRKGRFLGTGWQIDSVKPLGSIWSEFNAGAEHFIGLNPGGDANGDLWPSVTENTVQPHHPWVVWSRFNGVDYDLAWARWRGARWTPIRSVHRDTARGDDMDADMSFDAHGRPCLVWWRNEHGVGRVYLSVFLNSRWMGEISISDTSMHSYSPTIEITDDGRVIVEYETPRGLYAQVVRFNEPVTITDDINPFAHIELVGEAMMVRRR
jgi:hypothetical protein